MNTNMICNICHIEQPIENFAKRKDGKDGYEHRCKECNKKRLAKFRDEHPDYYDKYRIVKPIIVKTCIHCGKEFETKLPTQKRCSKNCKPKRVTNDLSSLTPEQRTEYQKQYYKQWCDTHQDLRQKWVEENKDYIKVKRREYITSDNGRIKRQLNKSKRMHSDINYRLRKRLSERIRQELNGNKKGNRTIDLLGCTITDARKHIERQFKDGMRWDNWGVFGWHIDHIIPISYFDLTIEEQQKRCFHYTNLQPLWWMDNVLKADKIETKQLILI